MTDSVRMKLVFRLGGIGFALPVQDLIEVREDPGGGLDRSAAEPASLVLGNLSHRGETIPVRDLGKLLNLPSTLPESAPAILVLSGDEGPWGVMVDRVEGVFPEAEFESRPLPLLLAGQEPLPYGHLDLWRDEPLVRCEVRRLERCWGRL